MVLVVSMDEHDDLQLPLDPLLSFLHSRSTGNRAKKISCNFIYAFSLIDTVGSHGLKFRAFVGCKSCALALKGS